MGHLVEALSVGTLAASGILFLWKAKTLGESTFRFQSSMLKVFRVPFSARFYEHGFRIMGVLFLLGVLLHVVG